VGVYYAGGVMVAATGLMLRTASAYEHLDGRLGVVLSFVCVWPWVAYVVTPAAIVLAGLPKPVLLAGTAGGYVCSALAAGLAVTWGGLFEAAPSAGTLGPDTVLANLEDAVVVVDTDERVVRLNDAAAAAFGATEADVVGTDLAAVVGANLATLRETGDLELAVADGTRDFRTSVTPVTDRHGRAPGHAVVFSDVTLQRVRAQRLAVLNRVLRHNLRNEMTRIVGRAEVIADEVDEHRDTAEGILETADELVDLGDRAQEVEEMMSIPTVDDRRTVLVDLAESVVAPYREAVPDAAISVDVDPSLVWIGFRSRHGGRFHVR
jgi:signal transduction histidine kinase